ncbi:MAG: hypothetical protein ACTSSJ_03025 [Candidatus Odinarchaeia archaeon]
MNLDKINLLNKIIDNVKSQGSFIATVIASEEGLPIAYAIIDEFKNSDDIINPEILAAVSADLSELFGERIFVTKQPEEVLVEYDNAKALFRSIETKNGKYTFVVVIPRTIKYFKRATNKIIRQVMKILS